MRFKDYVSDQTIDYKICDYLNRNTYKQNRYLIVQNSNLDNGGINYDYVDGWLNEHYDVEGYFKETERFSTIRSVCNNYSGFENATSYYQIFKDVFKNSFIGGYNKPVTIYLSYPTEFVNYLLTFVNCVKVLHSGEDYIHIQIIHTDNGTYADYIFNNNLSYVELLKIAIMYMEPDTKPEVLEGLEKLIAEFLESDINIDTIIEKSLEQQIKQINENISQVQSNIDYYVNLYNKELSKAGSLEKSKLTIKNSIVERSTVIKKYMDKKVITKITTHTDKIVYTLKTPIFNYSELSIKRRLKNYEDSPFKTFLQDVFCSEDYSLLVSTDIYITHDNYVYTGRRYACTGTTYLKGVAISNNVRYMPNPHIAGYNCFGTNGPQLTRLLNADKWEEFMQCLIATTGNLNFNDGVVTGNFFNVLRSLIDTKDDYFKCIIDKDGNELTIKEYLDRKEADDNETAPTI